MSCAAVLKLAGLDAALQNKAVAKAKAENATIVASTLLQRTLETTLQHQYCPFAPLLVRGERYDHLFLCSSGHLLQS